MAIEGKDMKIGPLGGNVLPPLALPDVPF
jgi:hypothetical protein